MRLNFKGKRSKASGLTLVELLITVAILAIALLGLLLLFIYCYHLARISGDRTFGMSAAQTQLEVLRNQPFTSIGDQDICFGPTVPPCLPGFEDYNGYMRVTVNEITPGELLQVTIVVCLESHNGFVFGEDKNLDGDLDDIGIDQDDGDTILESPITLVSFVANRN